MIDTSNTTILGEGGVIAPPPAFEGDEPAPLTGFHANTVEAVMAAHPELEPQRVTPADPLFRMAGDADPSPWTVCLRWDTQAAMYAALPSLAPGGEP